MYMLYIIWASGERSEYSYETEHEAYLCVRKMRKVFGDQVDYYWIVRK